MIEELGEYLIRNGIAENIADDLHDAYYKGMKDACRYARTMNDDQCDYLPEIVKHILDWRREVGEALDHVPEHVVASVALVKQEQRWFVDVTTHESRKFRYTVLGRTPYSIASHDEALAFAKDLVDDLIDEGCWVEIS